MVDDCGGNRLIGIVQPKKTGEIKNCLYEVGCVVKLQVLMKQKMADIL